MSDLRVVLVQTEQAWKDKEKNLAHFQALLDQVESCDLIVLPEMFHTSFCMDAAELAEEMNDSSALNFLKENASKHKAAIYTSFIAKEKNQFYNRGIFMFPNGNYEIYDKRKLFALAGEDLIFKAGSKRTIVNWKSWRINLQICYDLRFPEIALNSIEEDNEPSYHLSIYIANWPEKRTLHWKSLLPARAIENQAYVIGLNRVGIDGLHFNYSGDSGTWNPLGDAIINIESNKQNIVKLTLSKREWENVQEKIPFIKDRS